MMIIPNDVFVEHLMASTSEVKLVPEQGLPQTDTQSMPKINTVEFLNFMHQVKPTGRYHFYVIAEVTPFLVGRGDDSTSTYRVPWELVRREVIDGELFAIFRGQGDARLGEGHKQFEAHEIAVSAGLFNGVLVQLMQHAPEYFTKDKVRNIIGLEAISDGSLSGRFRRWFKRRYR